MGVNTGGKEQAYIEQLQAEVDKLQAVINRLASDEPIGWNPNGIWTCSDELQTHIALAKIHATEK